MGYKDRGCNDIVRAANQVARIKAGEAIRNPTQRYDNLIAGLGEDAAQVEGKAWRLYGLANLTNRAQRSGSRKTAASGKKSKATSKRKSAR